MSYCILCAIRLRLETKELAELLGGKAGRNSLTLKKLLSGIFHKSFKLQIYRSLKLQICQNSLPEFITWLQSSARLILKPHINNLDLDRFSAAARRKVTGMPRWGSLTAT